MGAKVLAELVPSNRVKLEAGKFLPWLRWVAIKPSALGICRAVIS
jgi:hypothetical protein